MTASDNIALFESPSSRAAHLKLRKMLGGAGDFVKGFTAVDLLLDDLQLISLSAGGQTMNLQAYINMDKAAPQEDSMLSTRLDQQVLENVEYGVVMDENEFTTYFNA